MISREVGVSSYTIYEFQWTYHTIPWIFQVKVVSRLSTENSIIPVSVLPGSIVSPPQQLMQLNWNVKKEIEERTETSPLREEYERQLKEFIDRNTVRVARVP
jgi:hypothetical protein